MGFEFSHFKSLVNVAIDNNASDIHIRAEETPCFRINGDMVSVKSNKTLTTESVLDILRLLTKDNKQIGNLEDIKDLDGAVDFEDICRLRFNYFRYNNKNGIVLRVVKKEIPSFKELGLSDSLKQIIRAKRGLILVTGATGSGKSTTLASMIDYINSKRAKHIITIEDPIEFIHTQKKSRITQREVGIDTENFEDGLKFALRQDPDIILLGELRDQKSVEIALKAAETGHLVLATVHTTDAISTISRIISMFSSDEQTEARKRLSDALYSTISQRMIKSKKSPNGVRVAQEIMVTGPGVKECIRGDEPIDRILSIIENGGTNSGDIPCESFDQAIFTLLERGYITEEDASKEVRSAGDFMRKLMLTK
ncbi:MULTISPECIES: type IV pilus twitching motility protein PilT [Halobacteriovorax]|uniref:PilT/PilU family type 4a pilus ATPase n=1 Tax=Halobacteriovorax vibrionivorans TaxID=2152716 RepID=A0ABY0IEC0_9BACT|nr:MULTISPECIES: PilT/PilU family type 4a pilus ATPase [Halobacteriovorax]AYF44182.1 twitching motility protein [Halobacteriovorax sp. BALOs_7]RZF21298.1 PilT/PilU family type 4a pilus ATPase [Halobacteriovorax vibrionivorans]TGD47944.1 PilT/PilU family type 4a pilus ATPase [Halobacteriovorax sp. Y22]